MNEQLAVEFAQAYLGLKQARQEAQVAREVYESTRQAMEHTLDTIKQDQEQGHPTPNAMLAIQFVKDYQMVETTKLGKQRVGCRLEEARHRFHEAERALESGDVSCLFRVSRL